MSSFSGSLWFFTLPNVSICDGLNSPHLWFGALVSGSFSWRNLCFDARRFAWRSRLRRSCSSSSREWLRFCLERWNWACWRPFVDFLYLAFYRDELWLNYPSCWIWNFCYCSLFGQKVLGACCSSRLWSRCVQSDSVHRSCQRQRGCVHWCLSEYLDDFCSLGLAWMSWCSIGHFCSQSSWSGHRWP